MNAPDPRHFTPGEAGASTPNGTFRLFHHGQVLRRYNFEVALDGFQLAKQQIPGLELDIYGDGEEAYLNELKAQVHTQGLSKSVRFHERVSVDQIPDLISNAHLGLVPCKQDVFVDKVMLPVRLLEYVVMGLPTVVARVKTVEAYFRDDEVAYYPPNDAGKMAERIVDLYKNPTRIHEMSLRAQKAFRDYEWPKMQIRYYRVLDRLLNS